MTSNCAELWLLGVAMWIAIYEALEWFGIVSCPQISPELYLREIKKKKGFTLLAVLTPQVRLSYHLRMVSCLLTI